MMKPLVLALVWVLFSSGVGQAAIKTSKRFDSQKPIHAFRLFELKKMKLKELQSLRKAYIHFLVNINKHTTYGAHSFSLFPEAYAATLLELCFVGGWPSKISAGGKCKVNVSDIYQSCPKGQWQCNPALFPSASDELDKGACVSSKEGWTHFTDRCYEATNDYEEGTKDATLSEHSNSNAKGAVFKKASQYQSHLQDLQNLGQNISDFCTKNADHFGKDPCDALKRRVWELQVKVESDQDGKKKQDCDHEVNLDFLNPPLKTEADAQTKFGEVTKQQGCLFGSVGPKCEVMSFSGSSESAPASGWTCKYSFDNCCVQGDSCPDGYESKEIKEDKEKGIYGDSICVKKVTDKEKSPDNPCNPVSIDFKNSPPITATDITNKFKAILKGAGCDLTNIGCDTADQHGDTWRCLVTKHQGKDECCQLRNKDCPKGYTRFESQSAEVRLGSFCIKNKTPAAPEDSKNKDIDGETDAEKADK